MTHGPTTPLAVTAARTPNSGTPLFAKFAWVVLAYTLLVILYGAWVRISGSGAGCGDHWPTCHGQIVPRGADIETWIEYGHRVTSGVLGPLCIALVVWAWRNKPATATHDARRQQRAIRWCALLTLLFVIFEALIGAGLVLAELVGSDASGARAVVISIHLVNTLILTAASSLTAWFGAGYRVPVMTAPPFPGKRALLIVLVGLVVVCATGAITALGDTLFPVKPTTSGDLWARVREDLSPGAHFLVRLRAIHPAVALLVGLYTATVAQRLTAVPGVTSRLAHWLSIAVWGQLVLGAVNIMLSAPGWMQLVHLLGAQVTWILAVLVFVAAGAARGGAVQILTERT